MTAGPTVSPAEVVEIESWILRYVGIDIGFRKIFEYGVMGRDARKHFEEHSTVPRSRSWVGTKI
jgi:hypothetical protein